MPSITIDGVESSFKEYCLRKSVCAKLISIPRRVLSNFEPGRRWSVHMLRFCSVWTGRGLLVACGSLPFCVSLVRYQKSTRDRKAIVTRATSSWKDDISIAPNSTSHPQLEFVLKVKVKFKSAEFVTTAAGISTTNSTIIRATVREAGIMRAPWNLKNHGTMVPMDLTGILPIML